MRDRERERKKKKERGKERKRCGSWLSFFVPSLSLFHTPLSLSLPQVSSFSQATTIVPALSAAVEPGAQAREWETKKREI